MDTIKNYLEAMFANMPNTEQVMKAKDELSQMMEDKYTELIDEGMAENAAVGTVISEFGNLDELADELGLVNDIKVMNDTDVPRRHVSLDEARDYVTASSVHGLMIAIGVMLCIMSVVGPILGDAVGLSDKFGVVAMFVMIAVAVGLFVYSGLDFAKWDYIEKENCQIDMLTANALSDEKQQYGRTHALRLTIGIVMCSICWLPAAVVDGISFLEDMGGILLFVMVGVGVFLIVYTSKINKSYDKMLGVNDSTKVSGNYKKDQDIEYISPEATLVMELYWTVISCIYLVYSFITFKWYISWMIWPVAAIARGALKNCLRKR